ncbi:VirK/YbjX family protein [Rhodovulum steppense]|uniref:Uncharacterized protein VirK/YbjX n=1 Tax=Rhodovulum steppense TaxID=540251 RepID=A0A4R1YMI9_9RHOB|nr:DUF535 family protein [Rhodovulum steppense]TCM78969.1 uncharacterized protein VirK/YbjX [Rhodovulum steppense]
MSSLLIVRRTAQELFPGHSPAQVTLRAKMLLAAARRRSSLRPLLNAAPGSCAHILIAERPEMLGALLWPYQNATWPAAKRFDRILAHCREIDRLGPPFPFSTGERLVLADLGAHHPGCRLVLDQPKWFMREGGLTLNLFVDSFRAYSLAFSLFRNGAGELCAYIGALQGRNTDNALDLYRDLTRALFGIRPRDFLIETLRMLARRFGIAELHAVSDAARHHRHPFFGAKTIAPQDYDTVWLERGGTQVSDDTFALPVSSGRRPLDEIKAKKRSLYRQRYGFLDALEEEIAHTLPSVRPVRFPDS